MQKEDYMWIRFYSKENLSLYHQFESAMPILDSFLPDGEYDINQAIELFNIKQILEVVICPSDVDGDKFSHYKSLIKPINKVVAVFFNKINQGNFLDVLKTIVNPYIMDFLRLSERYKVIERLDVGMVKLMLASRQVSLCELLQCECWVNKFDAEIADFMKASKDSPEIIIKHHLEKREERDAVFHMPNSLTPSQKVELLDKYIDSKTFHPNYVELIKNGSCDELPLNSKIKQKAEKAVQDYWNKYFEKHACSHYGAESRFDDIENEKEESTKGMIASYVFSRKWLKEHLDHPTLWNNFIFLFDFVDSKLRCSFDSKEDLFLTSILLGGIQGKKDYHVGMHFEIGRLIANCQMATYCSELKVNGIVIENLFDWFFNEYIKQEFGIDGFCYHKPSDESSMLEKCRSLCSEMDGILQQYSLYQENGEIDRGLLAYESDFKGIRFILSLQEIKYVYAKNGDFYREAKSLLTKNLMYGSNFDLHENENLATLLFHHKVTLAEFHENVQKHIEWLIERGSVSIIDDCLKLNIHRYLVIRDIYENKNTTWEYWEEPERAVLQDLIDRGDVDVGSTLLSEQECDYFNFVMNRKQFSNGWNLRNSLLHGTKTFDNGALPTVYIELLKIFVLVVIKINEEFRVKFG